MTPAYQKEDGQWYFRTTQGEEGPYDDQREAEAAWRAMILESNKCTTGSCEE